MATTVAAFAALVMAMGLETPVFRTWFELSEDPVSRSRYVTTARSLLVLSTCFVSLLYVAIVVVVEPTNESWAPTVVLIGLFTAIGQTWISGLVLPLLRAQDRLRAYLRLQLLVAVAQPSLLVLLVLVLDMGSVGWILALAVAPCMGAVRGMWIVDRHLGFEIDGRAARRLLGMGLPLIPHGAAHWSLAGIDRLLLLRYVDAALVGVYGLVYTVSAVVGTALAEFNRAILREYGRLIDGEPSPAERDRRLAGLSDVQVVAAVLVAYAVAAVGPPLFDVVFDSDYADGAAVIPWVGLGYMFFGLYYIPVNRLTVIEGRTGSLAVATTFGAVVNVVFNIILIPSQGIVGAAQATAIGYAAMCAAVAIYVRRNVDRTYVFDWRRIGPFLVAAGACAASTLTVSGVAARLAVAAILVPVLTSLGWLTIRSEVRWLSAR